MWVPGPSDGRATAVQRGFFSHFQLPSIEPSNFNRKCGLFPRLVGCSINCRLRAGVHDVSHHEGQSRQVAHEADRGK